MIVHLERGMSRTRALIERIEQIGGTAYFDPSEEPLYVNPFKNVGGYQAQYQNPLCQVSKADPQNPVAAAGNKKTIDLYLYGQGFLKGKSTVKIYNVPYVAGQAPVDFQKVDPDPTSTFRGG